MSSSAFLLLDKEPINTIRIKVLQTLMQTQGHYLTTRTAIAD
ncbi:helix-turn-helix transcriptional regulator, partial [Pseudoalteromonas citrea]